MADANRIIDGDPPVVRFPVDSGTVIEVGDLLFLDTDDVKPASDQASKADETTAKQDFADVFAGIATDASADGDTADIPVAVPDGRTVYEFGVASGTFEVFDQVSAEADANGDVTADQNVESTTTNAEAIGYIAKRYGSSTTSVHVIFNPIMQTRLSVA